MKPSHRTAALAVTAAGCAVAFSLQGTQAAFTATTTSIGTFTAGSVKLSDNDVTNDVLLNVGPLAQGASGEKCITVTYEGTLASNIRLHVAVAETDGGSDGMLLDTHLDIKVDYGTAGAWANCAGFSAVSRVYSGSLADMRTTALDFDTAKKLGTAGTADWTPAPPTDMVRVFKFTYKLADEAPNTVQGDTAVATFTWRAETP